LFRVNADNWENDLADSREFFAKFGERLPAELRKEHEAVIGRFQKSVPA
jgi:GTP-dependent phosphoenolpyruvate carboxykinase